MTEDSPAPQDDAPKDEAPKDEAPKDDGPKDDRPKDRVKQDGRGRGHFALWALGPVIAFVVLTALILFTGKPSANELMQSASKSFSEVERGIFAFEIAITPKGSESAQASSIKLSGPFELVPGKPLPNAQITYTITSGERSQTVNLVTTGDEAYTIVGGQAYELPDDAAKQLREATKQLSEGEGEKAKETAGLAGLDLNFEKWLIDPVVKGGGEVDGTPVWSTTAQVDVVAALQDLANSASALSGVTGSAVPKLSAEEIKQLKDSFSNAEVEVLVGRYDDIVREIDLTMDFATPSGLGATTGGITGGKLNVVIGITDPNQPVDVQAPSDPLPFESLQSLTESGQSGTALDDGVGK